MSDLTWTTRDGRKLRPREMKDSHLMNTIRLLERRARQKHRETVDFAITCPLPNGDIAAEIVDQGINEVFESDPEDYIPPIYYKMLEVARERGLLKE